MSHYVNIVTQITNEDALVRALCRVGFKEGQVLRCDTPQHLYGYQGDERKQTAHVILPRKYVGSAANDIGFERLKDGKYKAHISEYDHGKYGTNWQNRLYTYYGVEVAKMECDKRGLRFIEDVDEEKRPRLRIQMGG